MTPDLSSLAGDYDIVGELDGTDEARRYIGTRKGDAAKRRDDQTGVLITVYTSPKGDEANALSHLAADTQLLSRMAHRRLIPVVEGRWLGDDSFAVVTRRVSEPSLAQRLASGESFTTPRIAAILRDVNGLLEWARSQQVVHRSVTPDNVFLEPKTDRVQVTFAIAPIRRIRHSAEDDDARTIARLAMAMLTGEPDPASYDAESLATLRPGLPERLGAATEELLSEKHAGTPADVAAYLALIGMADPLAAGESEAGRIRQEILEEQRLEREAIAAERFTFDTMMEREREQLAADRAELERAVAEERARMERALTDERATLQRALEEERAALAAKRAELEGVVAAQRAELERAAAADRRSIEQLRAALQQAGELEIEKKRQAALEDITDDDSALDREELRAPRFVTPALAPLEPVAFDDDNPLLRDDPIDLAPPRELEATLDEVSESSKPPGPSTRQRWAIASAAVVAILIVVGISSAVIARRAPGRRTAVTSATSAGEAATNGAVRRAAARPAVIAPPKVDSVAAPTAEPDSAAMVASVQWMDSLREAHPLVRPRPVAPPPTDAFTTSEPAMQQPAQQSQQQRSRRDTVPRRVIMSVTDSIFNFRPSTPARRDSSPRRDSVARPRVPPVR